MIILKGQHLHVSHKRKGEFDAVALRQFDTETEDWYPLAIAEGSVVKGLSAATTWRPGEAIPCRKSLTTVTIVH